MPTERIAMRHVRETLRLVRDAEVPVREVARRLSVAPSTVRETLRRFEASGLDWPLPAALNDAVLESRLYGAAGTKRGHRRREEPDWAAVNRELKRKHVTLQVLWDEYIEVHPDGYRYSRFCDLYRGWEARLTGEIRDAHIFVAVMAASSLSFACASWTETLGNWSDAHVRAFTFFGSMAE